MICFRIAKIAKFCLSVVWTIYFENYEQYVAMPLISTKENGKLSFGMYSRIVFYEILDQKYANGL